MVVAPCRPDLKVSADEAASVMSYDLMPMRMMAGPMQQAVKALRSALRNAAAPQP